MTLGWVDEILGSQADFPGLAVASYSVRINEAGFHGLVRRGWVETAAQTVKCGEEVSWGQ